MPKVVALAFLSLEDANPARRLSPPHTAVTWAGAAVPSCQLSAQRGWGWG